MRFDRITVRAKIACSHVRAGSPLLRGPHPRLFARSYTFFHSFFSTERAKTPRLLNDNVRLQNDQAPSHPEAKDYASFSKGFSRTSGRRGLSAGSNSTDGPGMQIFVPRRQSIVFVFMRRDGRPIPSEPV